MISHLSSARIYDFPAIRFCAYTTGKNLLTLMA